MDVLSASSNDDKIAWYENDGTWTPRTWSPATYVCTSPTTWTPIAGNSSIALKGANPDTIVQNSGSYADSGGVCYDGNGTKVVTHCSDSSKSTQAACLAPHVEVTSGAPLASTDANYMTETECKSYAQDLSATWGGDGYSVSSIPSGCIRTAGYDVYLFNGASTSHPCGYVDPANFGRNCIQKTSNTWTQGITVSGQVDATAACGTEVTLTYDCPGAAQVSRKVVVECP